METLKYITFILLIIADIRLIRVGENASNVLRFILCLQLGDIYLAFLCLVLSFGEYVYSLLKEHKKEMNLFVYNTIPLPLIMVTIVETICFYDNVTQILMCVCFAFSYYYLWFCEENEKMYGCSFMTNLVCGGYCILSGIFLLAIEYGLMCGVSFDKYEKAYKIKLKKQSK